MIHRISALLVVFALVPVSTGRAQDRGAIDRGATVELRGVPLADALQWFVDRTGRSVAFDPGLVRGKTAWCVTTREDPEAWLRCLLEGSGLEFFRRGSGTYVIGPQLELPASYGVITGRVVDRETGAPLPGASVLLADAGRGTAADGSGRFALDRLLPGRYALTISHVGFEPWNDSLVVSSGSRTSVSPALVEMPLAIRPLVVEADRVGGDPWQAAQDASSLAPASFDRAVSLTSRLADRAGVALSDVTADVRIQGGAASDVSMRLDGVPLFVPRSIASFVGILGAPALDRITVSGAGFGASAGSSTGGLLDFRHAVSGSPGLEVQIDPYALSGSARLGSPGLPGRFQGLVSWRHGLGTSMLPHAIDRMLRTWSGPDPFLLVAPLRRYDLATPEAIGYATGLFVPADPSLSFDDLHAAARFRPRPTVSWDASVHVGSRSVGGSRIAAERSLTAADDAAILFSSVDSHDWTTRMAQVRHERVVGSRLFVTAQAWATGYELEHRYRLADRIGYRTSESAVLARESTLGDSRDGNRVEAWGFNGTFSLADGRHAWTGGIEAGHTISRFDLRLASLAAGTTADQLVPVSSEASGVVAWDTTSVFEAKHARVSNRGGGFLATVHLADRISLGRLSIEPGLRTTFRPERSTVYAEPRLRAAWSVPRTRLGAVSIAGAAGLYRQFVGQFDVSSLNAGAFFPSTRIWMPIDGSLRPPRSVAASMSVTVAPSRLVSFVVEGWVKDLRHTSLFNYAMDPDLLVEGARLDQSDLLVSARGLDRGVSVTAGLERARFSARLRYDGAQSWRQADRLFMGRRVPTAGHVPHRWTAGLDARPAPAFDLGIRAMAEIGRTWAFRPVYYDYFGHDASSAWHEGYDFSDPGAHSLPALMTFDLTSSWAVALGQAKLQIRGEVRNLFNRSNELDRQLLWNGTALAPAARPYPGRTAALAVRVVW